MQIGFGGFFEKLVNNLSIHNFYHFTSVFFPDVDAAIFNPFKFVVSKLFINNVPQFPSAES